MRRATPSVATNLGTEAATRAGHNLHVQLFIWVQIRQRARLHEDDWMKLEGCAAGRARRPVVRGRPRARAVNSGSAPRHRAARSNMASTGCAWLHGMFLVTALVAARAQDRVVIQPWGAHSLRIRAVPSGAEFPQASAASALDHEPASAHAAGQPVSPGGPSVSNGNIVAALDTSGRLIVTRASDRRELFVETKPRTITPREHDEGHSRWSNTSLFAVQVSATLRPEERLYGLGQHTSGTLNQRNQSLRFLPMNTEVFIPFVISSYGYGYLLNYPGAGNLAWSDAAAEWNLAAATQFDLWVTTTAAGAEGAWPPDLMSHYVDATGHAPVLPEWATGLWQSKNRYQTQQQLLDVVQGYRTRNLSISVIVADYFTWSPEFTTGDYDFDSTCWPSVGQMMAQLREWNVELMISTYGNFVSPDSKHYAAAVASGDLFATLPNGTVLRNGFQVSPSLPCSLPSSHTHSLAHTHARAHAPHTPHTHIH